MECSELLLQNISAHGKLGYVGAIKAIYAVHAHNASLARIARVGRAVSRDAGTNDCSEKSDCIGQWCYQGLHLTHNINPLYLPTVYEIIRNVMNWLGAGEMPPHNAGYPGGWSDTHPSLSGTAHHRFRI